MDKLNLKECCKCFEGEQRVYEHYSNELASNAKFSLFMPSVALKDPSLKLPVVYYLSGLTSTEQSMITKSGMQRYAEQNKLIIVGPDTSPRNCNVPHEDDEWDLGTGAGFYVDATEEPWKKHYRMYSYVTQELREFINANFTNVDPNRTGITGHSMGGHGALIAFFRNPQIYKAATAFAPITHPMKAAWGQKCMTAYLGSNESSWVNYDATELVKKHPRKNVEIIVEQGTLDKYYENLMPTNFKKACEEAGQPIKLNMHEGYDHGYYFVSTFIESHLKHFAKVL